MLVRGSSGQQVTVARGYSEINRVNQQRSITITADLNEDLGNARQIVRDMQASFVPPLLQQFPEVNIRWEGQQEQTNESVSSLQIGFGIDDCGSSWLVVGLIAIEGGAGGRGAVFQAARGRGVDVHQQSDLGAGVDGQVAQGAKDLTTALDAVAAAN